MFSSIPASFGPPIISLSHRICACSARSPSSRSPSKSGRSPSKSFSHLSLPRSPSTRSPSKSFLSSPVPSSPRSSARPIKAQNHSHGHNFTHLHLQPSLSIFHKIHNESNSMAILRTSRYKSISHRPQLLKPNVDPRLGRTYHASASAYRASVSTSSPSTSQRRGPHRLSSASRSTSCSHRLQLHRANMSLTLRPRPSQAIFRSRSWSAPLNVNLTTNPRVHNDKGKGKARATSVSPEPEDRNYTLWHAHRGSQSAPVGGHRAHDYGGEHGNAGGPISHPPFELPPFYIPPFKMPSTGIHHPTPSYSQPASSSSTNTIPVAAPAPIPLSSHSLNAFNLANASACQTGATVGMTGETGTTNAPTGTTGTTESAGATGPWFTGRVVDDTSMATASYFSDDSTMRSASPWHHRGFDQHRLSSIDIANLRIVAMHLQVASNVLRIALGQNMPY
ncbi:hypothetical protein DFP72DRAFT_1047854 [Ephemerocybe angulata]|uniref:Uncharacterized protein n=1 Tax=Ephemerocybe angulata TaxID=980116 RepID=A0A8H6HRU0_9AGAR|nr:hypothetical protein DFP72DRAFT_1047854 [Tulosesus angulatus]